MSDRSFLFLVCSGRQHGNSEQLARRAAAALPAAVPRRWLRLDEQTLPPFRDLRHPEPAFPPLTPGELALAEATVAATDLVFATPVYWYGLPAPAKHYLDTWTAWLRHPELRFAERMKGHRLWAVVVDASEPHEQAYAPLVDCLVRTADYLEMVWRGALLAHGNRPGDALTDEALDRAAAYFTA